VVLKRIDGVESADVSYEAGRAVVVYDPALTSPDYFIPKLEEMTGYQAEVMAPAETTPVPAREHDTIEGR